MGDYEKLEVWKRSHEFVLKIYRTTEAFPIEEKFGVVSQLRRAAASIPTNIAEGKGSLSNKKLSSYLDISRASAHEVKYLLLLSKDLGYIEENAFLELNNDCVSIIEMLTKFKKIVDKIK